MKHLICLFDGTQNSAASGRYEDITNIYRLNLAISRVDDNKNPQIIFYIPGPGNRGRVDKSIGGVFGSGLDQIVREAYVSISSNYDEGDKIYLFGFSRGGIAARALSCLIAESGLLKPIYLHHLSDAWRQFVQINRKITPPKNRPDLTNRVHKNVRIKFVGLFDCVLGRNYHRPNSFTELVFSNDKVSPIIDSGLHLLSIDEDRRRFEPMLWGEREPSQHIEQVWMPGVHGDIGGVGRPRFLGILSLLTMIAHVQKETSIRINDKALEKFRKLLSAFDGISMVYNNASVLNSVMRKRSREISSMDTSDMCHHIFDEVFRRRIRHGRRMIDYEHRTDQGIQSLKRYECAFSDFFIECTREAFEIG